MGVGGFAAGGGGLETRCRMQDAGCKMQEARFSNKIVGRKSEASSDEMLFCKYLQANTHAIVRIVK